MELTGGLIDVYIILSWFRAQDWVVDISCSNKVCETICQENTQVTERGAHGVVGSEL
jgi:hypothetical protein